MNDKIEQIIFENELQNKISRIMFNFALDYGKNSFKFENSDLIYKIAFKTLKLFFLNKEITLENLKEDL